MATRNFIYRCTAFQPFRASYFLNYLLSFFHHRASVIYFNCLRNLQLFTFLGFSFSLFLLWQFFSLLLPSVASFIFLARKWHVYCLPRNRKEISKRRNDLSSRLSTKIFTHFHSKRRWIQDGSSPAKVFQLNFQHCIDHAALLLVKNEDNTDSFELRMKLKRHGWSMTIRLFRQFFLPY